MNTKREHGRQWRKAIPERRDRLQSQLLVGVVGLLLLLRTAETLRLAVPAMRSSPRFAISAVAISVLFAVVVRALRSATTAAAVAGGMICLNVTYPTGWLTEPVWRSALTPLACLFVLTFAATRAGGDRKRQAGLAEGRRGRSASQVIANLSAAALSVTPAAEGMLRRASPCCISGFADLWLPLALKTACLAALVEATADTLSSELGQAFGGRPLLLSGLRRVDPGTDGAISLVGTAAGITGAALVAAAGAWAMHLDLHAFLVALGSGVLGLFADSVIGAAIERRGWIGNDLVNWISTVISAVAAALLMRP